MSQLNVLLLKSMLLFWYAVYTVSAMYHSVTASTDTMEMPVRYSSVQITAHHTVHANRVLALILPSVTVRKNGVSLTTVQQPNVLIIVNQP